MDDKVKMAHEWAMGSIDAGYVCETDMLVKEAWKYADAMQAEADKRNVSADLDGSIDKLWVIDNAETASGLLIK